MPPASSGPGDGSSPNVVRPSKRSKTETERTSTASGHEGQEASAATSQAVGGSPSSEVGCVATLSLPGLRINWPSSQLILEGVKTVKARPSALGYRNLAQPEVEMWLVETPSQTKAISNAWVLAGGAAVAPRPDKAQIVGTVTFSRSHEYGSLRAFRADRKHHRISDGGHYDWDGRGRRHAWPVAVVRRLVRPVPQPSEIGSRGQCRTQNRRYTVTFVESASTCGLPRGETIPAAISSGKMGNREATSKRSMPAGQGSAASSVAP